MLYAGKSTKEEQREITETWCLHIPGPFWGLGGKLLLLGSLALYMRLLHVKTSGICLVPLSSFSNVSRSGTKASRKRATRPKAKTLNPQPNKLSSPSARIVVNSHHQGAIRA